MMEGEPVPFQVPEEVLPVSAPTRKRKATGAAAAAAAAALNPDGDSAGQDDHSDGDAAVDQLIAEVQAAGGAVNWRQLTAEQRAERRQKRLQEKNRRAQARWRQRQKTRAKDFEQQMIDLNQQLAQVTAQNQALLAERDQLLTRNVELENRCSLLEKVMQIKQDAVPQHVAPAARSDEEDKGYTSDEHLRKLRNFLRVLWKESPEKQPIPSLEDIEAQLKEDVGSWLKAMGKEYVAALAVCFLHGADDPLTEAHARILELTSVASEVWEIQLRSEQDSGRIIQKLEVEAAMDEDAYQAYGPPSKEHWRKVVTAMQLTPDQRLKIVALRNQLFQKVGAILADRKQILAELQEAVNRDTAEWQNMTPADMQRFARAFQASSRLKDSLTAERTATNEFYQSCFEKDVISPIQDARASVESYPYWPDLVGISSVIAAEEGLDAGDLDALLSELSSSTTAGIDASAQMPFDSQMWNLVMSSGAAAGLPGASGQGPMALPPQFTQQPAGEQH